MVEPAVQTKFQKCQKMWKTYHAKFDVPSLESAHYLAKTNTVINNDKRDNSSPFNEYVLVDVRSKAEQQVSMIPSALTLEKFESMINSKNPEEKAQLERKTVVTYCTIGYRSGLEATRLRDTYDLNVMNLDGIVAYTHASADAMQENDSDLDRDGTFLINPRTKEATNSVHVFGPAWNVANEQFEVTYFSKFFMALQGLGVGFKALLQSLKGIFVSCMYPCRGHLAKAKEGRDLKFSEDKQ